MEVPVVNVCGITDYPLYSGCCLATVFEIAFSVNESCTRGMNFEAEQQYSNSDFCEM